MSGRWVDVEMVFRGAGVKSATFVDADDRSHYLPLSKIEFDADAINAAVAALYKMEAADETA